MSQFRNLFDGTNATLVDLSPNLGTEIDGIQLSQLKDAAKNDLALMLELRKLLVFHNQDLCDKRPVFEIDFDRYFGPMHIHQVGYSAKKYSEIFSTICKPGDGSCYDSIFEDKTGDFAWHLDVSLEEYPASFSFFVAIDAPLRLRYRLREPPRGLKMLVSRVAAVLRDLDCGALELIPTQSRAAPRPAAQVQERLHALAFVGVHTSRDRRKQLVLLACVCAAHQRIKDPGFRRHSELLEDHFTNNPEFQVRAMHKGTDSGTIIVWDNRILLHTTSVDSSTPPARATTTESLLRVKSITWKSRSASLLRKSGPRPTELCFCLRACAD